MKIFKTISREKNREGYQGKTHVQIESLFMAKCPKIPEGLQGLRKCTPNIKA